MILRHGSGETTQASLKRLKKQIYDDASSDSSEESALKGYASLPTKKILPRPRVMLLRRGSRGTKLSLSFLPFLK